MTHMKPSKAAQLRIDFLDALLDCSGDCDKMLDVIRSFEAETCKGERERCAALLEAQSERDVEASHYCRSGNAGESLRRHARRRKEDARAIRNQGDVSC